jgi:hypothetical protein
MAQTTRLASFGPVIVVAAIRMPSVISKTSIIPKYIN